jgi:transcriptional regulator with XRE-family HTH domain
MIKGLNLNAIEEALPRAGLSQAKVAKELKVSRTAVSNWFKGSAIPTPDKLLRIGMLLGLPFDQMVQMELPSAVPIVCYRKKAGRKTKDEHYEKARETGELLKRLVPLLPDPPLASASVLSEPRMEYAYIQKASDEVRKEMGLLNKAVIKYQDLIEKFARLHAVIVPVMWGEKQNHGNALNIHLPDSNVTWVFLNLDSNIVDFKFWMAHELGHSLAPKLDGDEGENFADAFAQALLFPQESVSELRPHLSKCRTVQDRITLVRHVSESRLISPLTIRKALEAFEEASDLASTDLGDENAFMAFKTNFSKNHKLVSEILFGKNTPEPKKYVSVCEEAFKTQIFAALKAYCRENDGAANYIHNVFGLALPDAKALAEELTV